MLFTIFTTFFKIGMFTIGGGYAMIPIIQEAVCDKYKWLTEDEFTDSISLTNSLPGPLATNAATFIGYRLKGVPGSLAAVAGTISPSIIIILLIAMVFNNLMDYPLVNYFFMGVRPAVFALMVSSVLKLAKSAKILPKSTKKDENSPKSAKIEDPMNLAVALVCFFCIAVLNITSIYMVLAAAAFAIIVYAVKNGKGAKHE